MNVLSEAWVNVSFLKQFHKQYNDFQIFYHYSNSTTVCVVLIYSSKMPIVFNNHKIINEDQIKSEWLTLYFWSYSLYSSSFKFDVPGICLGMFG